MLFERELKRLLCSIEEMKRPLLEIRLMKSIYEAVEEGVEFIFHSSIEEIFDNGENITHLKVNKFELVPDPNGGRALIS